MFRVAGILVLALGLGACVATTSEQWTALNALSGIQTEKRALTYVPLQIDAVVDATIDARSAAFAFETGTSYYLAYTLPEFMAPYSITVRSKVQIGSQVFNPTVQFLDAQHAVTRTYRAKTFEYAAHEVYKTLFVNPANRAERYMLVFTEQANKGQHIQKSGVASRPATIAGANGMVFALDTAFAAPESIQRMRFSPVGSLQIETRLYKPTRVGDVESAQDSDPED